MRHADPSASFYYRTWSITGRVGQWQTGMTKTGQRIIQGQAWVDDRRTVSRGQGRENKPGARAGINTQEI